jgi:arginine N-succinyltransferase
MRMLEEEGFSWEKYVDIFDGGPTMTVRTDQIRSVREAKDVVVTEISEKLGEHIDGDKMLVAVGELAKFRAAYSWTEARDGGVAIDEVSAAVLGLTVGDTITQVPRW